MDQRIPDITAEDIERIIRRDFAEDDFDFVVATLSEYGTEGADSGHHRVRMAVLKLANGKLNILRREVETAKHDYRDVLAYAEYPNYTRHVSPGRKLDDSERQRIMALDWQQYQNWLNGN
jgi:hypothetical protein